HLVEEGSTVDVKDRVPRRSATHGVDAGNVHRAAAHVEEAELHIVLEVLAAREGDGHRSGGGRWWWDAARLGDALRGEERRNEGGSGHSDPLSAPHRAPSSREEGERGAHERNGTGRRH